MKNLPEVLAALEKRLGEAREKHPRFATGSRQAINVIGGEMEELVRAQRLESRDRQVDEALDVMATCARFILGEHTR